MLAVALLALLSVVMGGVVSTESQLQYESLAATLVLLKLFFEQEIRPAKRLNSLINELANLEIVQIELALALVVEGTGHQLAKPTGASECLSHSLPLLSGIVAILLVN